MQGVGVITSERATPTVARVGGRRRALGLEAPEWALLGLLALFSLWVLGLDLYQVIAHGRVWTGTDGSYSVDQLQYLAWVQSASQHLLVSNLFVLHSTPADYLQPAVLISGLLVAAGVAPWLALLLWKPVAVLALFLAVRAFTRRALSDQGRGAWMAVMTLTLFYGSFTSVYGQLGVLGDLFPPFMSWGYPFALLALASIVLALVSYESARWEGRMSWTPAGLGVLAGVLHPWQGELMLVVLVLAEVFSPETRAALVQVRSLRALGAELSSPRVRLAAASIAGALIPLLYYLALDKLDVSWGMGRMHSKHGLQAISILLVVLPLGLVALTGYRGAARNFLIHASRLWPVATVLIFFQSSSAAGATPLHTFLGITLPLSVLAVDGCLRLGWRRMRFQRAAAVVLILLFTIPTTYYELKVAKSNAGPARGNPNFILPDERQAFDFLRRDPARGGVLSRYYLGLAVPAETGRHTYVGDCIWSEPNCGARQILATRLLKGHMSAGFARKFVRHTHARFVLADCLVHADLTGKLGPVLQSVHHFGCATVYQLR